MQWPGTVTGRCIVVTVLLGAVTWSTRSAECQSKPFAARLTTQPGEVVARDLRATEPDPADPLTSVVESLRPALNRFFGVDPNFRWSHIPSDSNAYADPGLGIIVSRAKVDQMRGELDSQAFADVLHFILAHETAHIAQFDSVPALMRDPTRIRVKECHADLLAGLAVHSALSELGVPLQEFTVRTRAAFAAAHSVGHGLYSPKQEDYPTPVERSLCTTVGVSAGIQFRMIQMYDSSQRPDILQEIVRNRAVNPILPTLGDTRWIWSLEAAQSVVREGGRPFIALGSDVDFGGLFRRAASAAERGRAAIRANVAYITPPPPARCELKEAEGTTVFECVYGSDAFVSGGQAQTLYRLRADLLGSLLQTMGGWAPGGEEVTGRGRRTIFVSAAERRATAAVEYVTNPRAVSVRFTAGLP